MDETVLEASPDDAPPSGVRRRRKAAVRNAALLLWGALIALETLNAVTDPTSLNIGIAVMFVLLCVCVSAQIFVARWANNQHWRRLVVRMHGTNYLAEAFNLPNRNYLMSELRREMPRARQSKMHFYLLQVSFDSFVEVRMRRGQEFCDRALGALAATLERVSGTDFLSYLEQTRFVILVNDTDPQSVMRLLRTIPGAIPVSDGHTTWDVPVSARVLQYDREALYASDLIRELEESAPLRRRDQPLTAEAA